MLEIFNNYWENTPFVYLHSGALLLSLAVIALWCIKVRAIRRVLDPSAVGDGRAVPRSESDLSGLVAPLEPFASYFDYCSSAFIFIGLLGTMFGFVSGVPKMADENYQFKDILQALSTSAVGIMLALAFNLVTLALDYFLFRPVLGKLRRQLQGDTLENSIRENLAQLESTLGATLATFNSGISQIVTSLDAWNTTSQRTLAGQSQVAAAIAATQQGFVDTHQLLLGLPESIREQLAGVFSEATSSMATTLGKIRMALESFEKLPVKIEGGIEKSFRKRQEALEQALANYRDGIESQRSSLDELYVKLRALPLDVADSLSQSSGRSIVLMEQSHAAFLNGLKTAVRATVEDQMASLGALVGQMDLNAKTLREKWDALLSSERKSFEGAILSALHAAIQSVDEQRKKILTMESTLPESLATTFHELIKESQAATHILNQATRQEGSSMMALQAAIADFTAALRETRGQTPESVPQIRTQSAPTPTLSQPMHSPDSGMMSGPPSGSLRTDSFAAAIARSEPTDMGRPTTDIPPRYDDDKYSPMMPLELAAERDGNQKPRFSWPRRLWERVRPSAGTQRS